MRNIIDVDLHKRSTILIAGMGRSGTTLMAEIVNYDRRYRDIFEPFLPHKVHQASVFRNYEYLPRETQRPEKEVAARMILSGHVSPKWINKFNRRRFSWQRIIKDIRCNLMLGWLKDVRPTMPIVFVVRHPLSVIRSWLKLRWGATLDGKGTFDHVVNQRPLLEAFPIVEDLASSILTTDVFERTAWLWCVLNMVPLAQLTDAEMLVVRYEDLLADPLVCFATIFSYIGRPYNEEIALRILRTESSTNFLNRDISNLSLNIIKKEFSDFSIKQIDVVRNMVIASGLNRLYGEGWWTT